LDPTFITPFVKSVQNTFETMLQLPVEIGKPELKQKNEPSFDISGIIGMSGDIDGTVVLSFPVAVAERTVSLFTGAEIEHTHEDFADAVGELVNMVSGGAKAQFTGRQVNISCPSVVIGKNHQVFSRKDAVNIIIPCTADVGRFNVEVSIRDAGAAQLKATA